jgi:Penicillin binding protein transpeptidase domain/NTF2-like N-terminal transpeptidase domain
VADGRSRAQKRLIIFAGVVLAVAITAVGVLQLLPDDNAAAAPPHYTASEAANQFLAAFGSRDAAEAGALTDDPAAATKQLDAVFTGLHPITVLATRTQPTQPAEPAAGAATEPFELTWDFGGGHAWEYASTLPLVEKDTGWKVHWHPGIVHRKLTAGHSLVYGDLSGTPAVVDRFGKPLLNWADGEAHAVDPKFAPELLDQMASFTSNETDPDAWYVALTDAAGKESAELTGTHPKPLVSTLDMKVQRAAQRAVDSTPNDALVVAIEPSTGDLLAVAQNAAAGPSLAAFSGLYPPGSTFKIATATAILGAERLGIDNVVPCPGEVRIGGRTIHNANFELGDVPLRTAFAQSCNTTFAQQAAGLGGGALPAAASRLGLAADFEIPGVGSETGNVPPAANTTEQVENSIGQGGVEASCFGMALVAATVESGRAVTPRLWHELPTVVQSGYQAPPARVIAGLRTMMRDVVTSGRGKSLAGYGDVHGKTGTAQVGSNSADRGWFVGYRGDLAFATLTLDSPAALPVTGEFLGAV